MTIRERLHVRVSGLEEGQPMIFAHGFGCDQSIWRFVAPEFAQRYRVITFDLVGAAKRRAAASRQPELHRLIGPYDSS